MPNISFVTQGEGEVILFLHGWGQNKEMMLPLADQLKYSYKCVLIDMCGFGGSPFNSKNDLEMYTDEIRFFLEKENLLPKYIVGHSFGGKAAIQYQLKYEDLKGLVIIASPLLKPRRSIKYRYKVVKYKIKKRLGFKDNNGGSEDYKNCSDEMKPFFVRVVNTHFDKDLAKISVPVMLIWGNQDDKVPLSKAKKMHKKLKGSQLYVQKGGHFAYLENIQLTRLIIQKFFRGLKND